MAVPVVILSFADALDTHAWMCVHSKGEPCILYILRKPGDEKRLHVSQRYQEDEIPTKMDNVGKKYSTFVSVERDERNSV